MLKVNFYIVRIQKKNGSLILNSEQQKIVYIRLNDSSDF
jgi:hypothetical protein